MLQRHDIIDNNTGQILKRSDKNFTVWDPQKGCLFMAKNYQHRTFNNIKLSDVVKDKNDFLRCHILAENLYKNTNVIYVRINSRKIRFADIEDISMLLNMCIRNTKEYIKRMVKVGIIAERTETVGDIVKVSFVMSPLYWCSDKYLSPELYFLFQESLNQYLKPWQIELYHELQNIKKLV